MDFIRFTGEWLIYYVLMALGGGVLVGVTVGVFEAIGLDVGNAVRFWLLPCGAVGAVVVAAWPGGGEAERHREHGARVDQGVHPAVRRDNARVPRGHAVDRHHHRGQPRPEYRAFVAETAGEVVGMVRDRRVGALLMSAVLDEARRLELEHVTVYSSTRAVPFYERNGWGRDLEWLSWASEA